MRPICIVNDIMHGMYRPRISTIVTTVFLGVLRVLHLLCVFRFLPVLCVLRVLGVFRFPAFFVFPDV